MEKESQFDAIWQQAKDQYKSSTGLDLEDPASPHPSSVTDLLDSLDKQNTEFKHFREKRALIFGSLEAACKPIEALGSLVSGAAASAFPPSSLCFGAVTNLINAAHGVSASYDAISDLFSTLKDFLARLQVYDEIDLTAALREKLAEILATLLEIFARSTKVVKSGSLGRMMHFSKNILVGVDGALQGLVTKLEKLCQGEHRLVGAETLNESKKTGRAIEGVSVTVTETNTVVQDSSVKIDEVSMGVHNISLGQEEFRREMRQEMRNVASSIGPTSGPEEKDMKLQQQIKAILDPSVSPLDIYNDIAKRRVPGTGDWIRTEQQFKDWTNCESQVLWVSGNPGSGKTFVSQNIISFLQELHPQGTTRPECTSIGYFFFKDSNPETRSFHQALRDLAYQIYQDDPVYRKYIQQNCHSVQDIKTIQSAWRTLFTNYFSNTKVDSNVFLVFDGVDEAFQDDRKTFLQLLSDLNEATPRIPKIQVVLVGRPEIFDDLAEALDESPPTIHVDWHKNSRDIAHYVKVSIKKSRVLSRAPKALRLEIEENITENAQGMFIWVDLMLRELSKKSRPSSIREALNAVPRGLNDMLCHVLENFSSLLQDEEPDDLNEMLAWVACGARPMKLGELDVLLKMRSPEGDGVFNLENMLRKQYASFFTLIREDGLTTADLQGEVGAIYKPGTEMIEEDGLEDIENETDFDSNPETTEVVFCHASIGDFFRDKNHGKVSRDGCPPIGVDIIKARAYTLKFCLEILCGTRVPPDPTATRLLGTYVCTFWDDHLSEAVDVIDELDTADKEEIAELLVKVIRDESIAKRWVGVKKMQFFAYDFTDLLVGFLNDDACRLSLDNDTQAWLDSAVKNRAEFYHPAANVAAKEWLDGNWWMPGRCAVVITSVIAISEGWSSLDLTTYEFTLDELSKAAEWLPMEKTANWHRRFGMCLRQFNYPQAAIDEFTKALEINDGFVTARGGLALTYMQLKNYTKAIELLKVNQAIAEKVAAENPDGSLLGYRGLGNIYLDLAACYTGLSDPENALEYYQKSFAGLEGRNRKYETLVKCMTALRELPVDNDDEIMRLFKSLDKEIEGQNMTQLSECLFTYTWSDDDTFFELVASAAKSTGELVWLEDAYQKAINHAKRKRKPSTALGLDLDLADLYSRFDTNYPKAIEIWKKILSFPDAPSSDLGIDIHNCKEIAEDAYAKYLFTQFLKSDDTALGDQFMEELLGLAKYPNLDQPSQSIKATMAALYVGIWHRQQGQSQIARLYFKPYIRERLLLLSDDDPENDTAAWYELAHVLVHAGHDSYALAILHIHHKEFDLEEPVQPGSPDGDEAVDSNANNAQVDGTKKKKSPEELMAGAWAVSDGPWECDGCGRWQGNWTDGRICRFCDSDLCAECFGELQKGSLEVCSPQHDWLHVPAPEKVAAEGEIFFEGKMRSVEEFKDLVAKHVE